MCLRAYRSQFRRFVVRRTNFQAGNRGAEFLNQRVINAFLGIDSTSGGTVLPGIVITKGPHAAHYRIQIGIIKNDHRGFAAQFHIPGTFAPIASWELLKEAVKAAEENGAVYHVGNVNSSDVFYGDHELVPEGLDSLYGLKKMGVMALEMEAAALYMNAARYGKRALCICTISDHILTGEDTTSEQRQNSFTTMMKVALDTAVAMENK